MAKQTVSYNGVVVKNANVSHSGMAVYDSTDRTLRYFRMQFSVSGLVYAESSGPGGAALFLSNLNTLNTALSQPRKPFAWTIEDPAETILYCISDPDDLGAGTTHHDVSDGPKPRNIQIQQITGGRCARVSFIIETCVVLCAPLAESLVDSFSYGFSYSYDANLNATRQVHGIITARSRISESIAEDFIHGTNSVSGIDTPDNYIPKLPRGFNRQGWQYSVSPDGLSLSYSFTDQQVWRTFPSGITGGSCSMTVTNQGANLMKVMQGFFSGPSNLAKGALAQVIINLIEARFADAVLGAGGGAPTSGERFDMLSFTNHDFENRIDFRIASTMASVAMTASGGIVTNIFDKFFGDIKDQAGIGGGADSLIEVGEAVVSNAAGTALQTMIATTPFSSCEIQAIDSYPNVNISEVDFSREDTADVVAQDFSPGGGDTGQNDEHIMYPYTVYTDCIQYILDYKQCVHITCSPDASSNGDRYTNAPDVIQQVGRPQLRMIHTGFARRLGKMPIIPRPYFFGGAAVLLLAEPKTMSPRLLADGISTEFSMGWADTYYLPGIHTLRGGTIPTAEERKVPSSGIMMLVRPPNQQIDENSADYAHTHYAIMDADSLVGDVNADTTDGTVDVVTPPV